MVKFGKNGKFWKNPFIPLPAVLVYSPVYGFATTTQIFLSLPAPGKLGDNWFDINKNLWYTRYKGG